MVVKRQCSFCADEIEPGTGMMFVKRDGTVFHFCSSSCRKQQLHLGRVGHRLKWTRAHALKRAAEQAQPAPAGAAASARPKRAAGEPARAPAHPPKEAEAPKPAAKPTRETPGPPAKERAAPGKKPAKKPKPSA
jgi:large subunit ribosomal protein L24e